MSALELPSIREIELETLLRQREKQLSDLSDELVHLRQYLSSQPPPSTNEPFNLPPALVHALLPHINARNDTIAAPISELGAEHVHSSSATAALLQRAQLLQDENDELYELLKHGEVGRVQEEAAALRRLVQRLEAALKESHATISSLSDELEKVVNSKVSAQAQVSTSSGSHPHQERPGANTSSTSRANGSGRSYSQAESSSSTPVDPKYVPTGPKSSKKQRVAGSDREPPLHTSSANSARPPSRRDDHERRFPDSQSSRDDRGQDRDRRNPPPVNNDRRQERPRESSANPASSSNRDRQPPPHPRDRDRRRSRSRSRSPRLRAPVRREPDRGRQDDHVSHPQSRTPSRSRAGSYSRSRSPPRNGQGQRAGADSSSGRNRGARRRRKGGRGDRRSPPRNESALATRLAP